MESFAPYYPAICAGLGLFLAGTANLTLARKQRRVRVAATVAAAGIALWAATAFSFPGAIRDTARLLAFGLIPVAILSSPRAASGLASVVAALGRPVVCHGLVAAIGVGTALGALVLYQRADEAKLSEAMLELELLHDRIPSTPTEREKAATDLGSPVTLRVPVGGGDIQRLSAVEERYLRSPQLRDQVIRQGDADDRSNCHGWVFTGGRFILGPEDVELILRDNGYGEQPEPRAGDLAIYRHDGIITHTGIVLAATEGQAPLIRSKWGHLGIYLHSADRSPYGTNISFYRSSRPGHLISTRPVVTTDSASPMVGE